MQAKSKGFHSKYDIGVKYAEKQQRKFAPEKLKEGRNVIGLQVQLFISIKRFTLHIKNKWNKALIKALFIEKK